jgi:hypothetical protein
MAWKACESLQVSAPLRCCCHVLAMCTTYLPTYLLTSSHHVSCSPADTMNFYAPPPTITASLYVRIPDAVRCKDKETEWRGGFTRPFQYIFLEGPVYATSGDLFVVDVPYGRILRISPSKEVSVEAEWDGEPNGLAVAPGGQIAIADYKQVGAHLSLCNLLERLMS